MRKIFGKAATRWLLGALALVLALGLLPWFVALGAIPLPQVRLNTDSIGPRPIEELTEKNIARDYALALRDFEYALSTNDPAMLGEYFTGIAKETFNQRVSSQQSADIRVRYTDHGHKVDALFYSPDGGEMQLVDHASFEIEIFDGSKLIHQEDVSQKYLVLMTPGADRWLVRSLEPIPESQ